MHDPHSYARPAECVVRHLDLDLDVDFERQVLVGRASLLIHQEAASGKLHLDSRDLTIRKVTLGTRELPTRFTLGESTEFLGQELAIDVHADTDRVNVYYETSPQAAAVQWLRPQQTAGKKHPFLFTQSQAILARTWIPCQDSPAVRMTYRARVKVPPGLMAVMSASNSQQVAPDGEYQFEMHQPIPSYLMALAVGDLAFRSLGERTGVYAEPSVVEAAAYEFVETEEMMVAAERLYGPYAWDRYDLLVLPPSFPFGGMENPRLTFATPTILAGDRSLVALVAHELAHSWSGNLVTAATWNDFWLNEGFTVYFERRIMEEIKGREYAEMLATLGLQDLRSTLDELGKDSKDAHLFLDLEGRDPDDGMTDVAYEKGAFFLRSIENEVGRARMDEFLKEYFHTFRFKSMDTRRFVAYLKQHLIGDDAQLAKRLQVDAWIYSPATPSIGSELRSRNLERVVDEYRAFERGEKTAEQLEVDGWTTHHWIHFLRHLPDTIEVQRMADLDARFHFTDTRNSEVLFAWLMLAIGTDYRPADDALRDFLLRQGRRKYLKPLYKKLSEATSRHSRALDIYLEARPSYHSVSVATLDELLDYRP